MDLQNLRNDKLKEAVRGNLVSFPAQAPVYERQSKADVGWRVAVLYYVRGWSLTGIGNRYGVTRERAGQILNEWRVRSIKAGYIQEIPAL